MDTVEKYIAENRTAFDAAPAPAHLWGKIDAALCTHQKLDLEHFIASNREALDVAEPMGGLWEKIDESLIQATKEERKTGRSVSMWPRYLMRAAAAAVLLIGGIGIGMQLSKPSAEQGMANVLTYEQGQAIGAFEHEVHSKMKQAATFVSQNPEIKADLDVLDLAARELKRELKDVPPGNRKQVVHAMLENYKAKVHILERILSRNIESETYNETYKSGKHVHKEI